MKEKTELHPILQLKSLWEGSAHNVWLASTLLLSRNLAKFKFPAKLDKARQHQVVSLLYEGLKESKELQEPHLFRSEEVGPVEKEFLLEHFLLSDGFYQAHGGEGFILDKSSKFLGIANVNDHLQLLLMDTDQELEKSWNRLTKIETLIGKSVDFAYNSRFGFLTSQPTQCGTALTVSLFLHLPAVIRKGELPELLEKEREEEIAVSGLQGNTSEMIGDLLIARNACTLGISEEYILTSLRMFATRAVVAEVTQRKKLREAGDEAIKTQVTRALGLLTHSYQLETIESLNALSLLKLGIELGWIEAPADLNLNQVFFNCRRAHLLTLLEKRATVQELPRKRAEYLQSIAKQLKLVI